MKICIIKLSALGDIIHSMVVLQFIKKQYSDITIDWLVEQSFAPILQNNPDVNKILPISLKSIKKNKLEIFNQIALLNQYSTENYDIVIDAQGLLKSAICSKIVGNKTVNSFIVGFDKNSIRETMASWFYDKTTTIGYEKNVIERNCKLISDCFNIKITQKDIQKKQPFLFFKKIDNVKSDIIFVVGASKSNKIYPKESFAKIANALAKYSIEVIWGNNDEKEIASYLQTNCDNVTASIKVDLDQLKSKISNTKLVIGADTGPTHMAWALNIPSITIFGNTPEQRNTYITDINKVVKSNSIVDPLKLDKNDFSIKEIKASNIVDIAIELLETK